MDLLILPIASICKTLGDENRIRILLSLGEDKKSVSQLVDELGISQPLVSHHLKELRRCHLLRAEKKGSSVYYELSNDGILSLILKLNKIAREIIESHEPF